MAASERARVLAHDARDLYIGHTVRRLPLGPSRGPDPLAFYRDHVAQGVPVCIAGGASHWPALKRWTNAYLAEKTQGETVSVALTPNGRADAVWEAKEQGDLTRDKFVMPDTKRMPFDAFAKMLSSTRRNGSPLVPYVRSHG